MPRRVKRPPVNGMFTEKPEWQAKVQSVINLKARGFDEAQIAAVSLIPAMEINRIIDDETTFKKVAKQSYENKIPLMQDIVGAGLTVLGDCLKELLDPEVRAKMITKVSDMVALKSVVNDVAMLLRLEEGKSTMNVSNAVTHSYQQTRKVLQDLRKKDPVFDYSELPEALPKPDDS